MTFRSALLLLLCVLAAACTTTASAPKYTAPDFVDASRFTANDSHLYTFPVIDLRKDNSRSVDLDYNVRTVRYILTQRNYQFTFLSLETALPTAGNERDMIALSKHLPRQRGGYYLFITLEDLDQDFNILFGNSAKATVRGYIIDGASRQVVWRNSAAYRTSGVERVSSKLARTVVFTEAVHMLAEGIPTQKVKKQ